MRTMTPTDLQGTRLGRIPSMKDRDQALHKFPRRATEVEPLPYKYHYTRWRPDQGNTGTCVGHGVSQAYFSGPVTQREDPSLPFKVYDQAIMRDVWTDNDHDPDRQFGTSVDAGMLVGRDLGWWESFQWCYDLRSMIVALQRQMVVMGTWWTDAMFNTDEHGFLHFEGDMVGGHCYATYGYNLAYPYRVPGIGTNSFTIRHGVTGNVNSWGRGWGKDGKGTFLLSFDDHEALIQADGECAVPVTEKKAA